MSDGINKILHRGKATVNRQKKSYFAMLKCKKSWNLVQITLKIKGCNGKAFYHHFLVQATFSWEKNTWLVCWSACFYQNMKRAGSNHFCIYLSCDTERGLFIRPDRLLLTKHELEMSLVCLYDTTERRAVCYMRSWWSPCHAAVECQRRAAATGLHLMTQWPCHAAVECQRRAAATGLHLTPEWHVMHLFHTVTRLLTHDI